MGQIDSILVSQLSSSILHACVLATRQSRGGRPRLFDAVLTKTPVTASLLDNSTTGMTGQQPHAASGVDLHGAASPRVDLVALVRSIGIDHVVTVDTWDRGAVRKEILGAVGHDGPAVVVCHGPCQMLPEMRRRDFASFRVSAELCTECNACYRVHCPAITEAATGLPVIDPALCVACGVCQELCHPGAIEGEAVRTAAAPAALRGRAT